MGWDGKQSFRETIKLKQGPQGVLQTTEILQSEAGYRHTHMRTQRKKLSDTSQEEKGVRGIQPAGFVLSTSRIMGVSSSVPASLWH